MRRSSRNERRLADELLSGVRAERSPLDPSVRDLARAVAAVEELRAPAAVDPERAELTIAAMAAVVAGEAPARRRVPLPRPAWLALGPRIAALGMTAALASGTGLAMTGALPAPAQDAAHNVFSKVGVNVPRAHNSPDSHPGNKGGEVSGVAHSTSPDDHGKGAEVSDKASDGRSHAGEDHGGSSDDSNGKKKGDDDSTPPPGESRREDRRGGHGPQNDDDQGPGREDGSD